MQQLSTATLLAFAAAWLLTQWPTSALRAAVGALMVLFAHGLFLAVEFLLLRRAGRNDPTVCPAWNALLRAWCNEVLQDIRVFAWRQPFCWRQVPDHLGAEVRGKRGAVFIHGFACNRGFWLPWLARVRRHGHGFVAVNLEPVFGSIDAYSETVERAVSQVTLATGLPPVLVCHSMGGLAARAWLRQAGDASRVHHVVTIGTPHQGTWLARFSRAANGRQMRLSNEWLLALQAAEAQGSLPSFTCWYSNCDNVVFPPQCATLPDANNLLLQGAAHVDLAFRPDIYTHFLALLASPGSRKT
ncbi:alpha/beta fold hydrolase [Ramlibacter sp.]|uniref:alpha/beta fold hydrolase n=1 Tax=Ramlibacter sp. TaxID=1917967 RepID=UPI0025F3C2CF|nr:alpha/beta fold hydrolase [Ramlibacter sp.]